MKIIITIIAALILTACAQTPAAIEARKARDAKPSTECRRSPYCDSYNPAGKTDAQIEQDLRHVREAVEASKQ